MKGLALGEGETSGGPEEPDAVVMVSVRVRERKKKREREKEDWYAGDMMENPLPKEVVGNTRSSS